MTGDGGRTEDLAVALFKLSGRFGKDNEEAGRAGGPIGLLAIGLMGEKRPDLLLSETEEGVEGSCARLSMVRSDSDPCGRSPAFGIKGEEPGEERVGLP